MVIYFQLLIDIARYISPIVSLWVIIISLWLARQALTRKEDNDDD